MDQTCPECGRRVHRTPGRGRRRTFDTAECRKAAEYLDIPERRLRDNWRRWGIRAYKVGRELRFRERDIEAYLSRNVEGAAA